MGSDRGLSLGALRRFPQIGVDVVAHLEILERLRRLELVQARLPHDCVLAAARTPRPGRPGYSVFVRTWLRRFSDQHPSVRCVHVGRSSPQLMIVIRLPAMPRDARYARVASARRSPSARLYSFVPRSSQCPSIRMRALGFSFSHPALVSRMRASAGRMAQLLLSRPVVCRVCGTATVHRACYRAVPAPRGTTTAASWPARIRSSSAANDVVRRTRLICWR